MGSRVGVVVAFDLPRESLKLKEVSLNQQKRICNACWSIAYLHPHARAHEVLLNSRGTEAKGKDPTVPLAEEDLNIYSRTRTVLITADVTSSGEASDWSALRLKWKTRENRPRSRPIFALLFFRFVSHMYVFICLSFRLREGRSDDEEGHQGMSSR